MYLFNFDKIAEDYGILVALVILLFWPLIAFMIGTVARFTGSENSKFNEKVEHFLLKYSKLDK